MGKQKKNGWVACMRKQRYLTAEAAKAAALRVEEEYGDKMKFYRCDICRTFHLTRVRKH